MSFDDLDLATLRRRSGEKWARFPEDVIPAWVADMDFPVADPIAAYLRDAVRDTDVGYPDHPRPNGLPAIFAARAKERYGWELDPGCIEVITDVVQGMYVALWVLTQEREGAVVQPPVYPPFLGCVEEVGRRMVSNELVDDGNAYRLDLDALRRDVDDRTRVLMFCNPQNPTGRVFTRAELEGIAQIALERDLFIISDEIHGDLVYPDHVHVPIATLSPKVEARTITLTSATKAFNIAGLRCAVAIFGSEALKARFNSLPRHIRGGLGSMGLAATEIAWTQCDDWLASTVAYLDANRRFVADFMADKLPAIRHHMPEATYLAWLDCRELGIDRAPYDFFLREAKVGLSDGRAFGRGGEGFVRLNFATPRPILTEILERMAKAVTA